MEHRLNEYDQQCPSIYAEQVVIAYSAMYQIPGRHVALTTKKAISASKKKTHAMI